MIASQTRAVAVVIFAPAAAADAAVERTLARLDERLKRWAAGDGIRWEILLPGERETA